MEIQTTENELDKSREVLKVFLTQNTAEGKVRQADKIKTELANLDKLIKEKEAYKSFQKQEFELKTAILKKLEDDLIETENDINDYLTQEEEHSLNFTLQKISIDK